MESSSKMDSCGQFIKYSMFVINFILFIGGITVFGIGIWSLTDKSFITEILGKKPFTAIYIMIATGGFVSLISFFGCFGSCKEIKCYLLTYFIILLIIFIILLAGGIFGYVLCGRVRHLLEQKMNKTITQYNDKEALRKAWDDLQENLHCCGMTDYKDWKGFIPESCCREVKGMKVPCTKFPTPITIYTDGCLKAAEVSIKSHASVVGGAAIIVACIMLLGLISSLTLFNLIK